jgi:hypothetical protein
MIGASSTVGFAEPHTSELPTVIKNFRIGDN